uniref:HYR domain-containing protein n=1 Tax=Ancylomarina sp. TaxID=1970196 RepID=UPI0035669446
ASLVASKTTFDCSNIGANTVTLTVTDNNTQVSTCTSTVTVEDKVLPTINCPGNVSVNADAGNCTASSVALGTPTTADNCSIASVTNDEPAVFPIGNTTVTWTVEDGSGNTATCDQTVTVTKENNIEVVDVTGTSDPETNIGIINGTHCPDLNGLQAVITPSGNTYSAGISQVQFRVNRLCDTGAWSFAYLINGADVDKLVLTTDAGTPINASNVISVPAETNYVLFTIDVDNEINTALPIDFKISDGGTESAIKDEITIQHNLKIIPLIGGFE